MAGTYTPILRTVESKLYAQRGGRLRINYLHWLYSGSQPSSAELANLNADIEANIIQEYEDFVAAGTQWYQIVSTDLETSTGATATRNINRISAGSIDDFPGNVSYVLSKRSGQRGRSRRGRFYLIDLPEEFFNGDVINFAVLPALNDLIAQMLLPRQSGRFTPAIASRVLGDSVAMTAITHDGVADSQRRRLTGRGA